MKTVDTVPILKDHVIIQIYPMIWTNHPEHQPIVALNVVKKEDFILSLDLSPDEARKIAGFLNVNADEADRLRQVHRTTAGIE